MDNRPPPPYISSKGMWVSKLMFRIFSVIGSLIIIGLTAYMTVDWYAGSRSYYYGGTPILALGPPAVIGVIWDVAEAICILARRGHRGIHPGAIVAIDLLLWLGFIAGTVMFALYHLFVDTYTSSSYYYDELMPLVLASRAALAFSALEIIFHITLFIFGCYETSARNRRPPMAIYPGAPQMTPGSHPYSQYGPPIMLPVGQAPPAGYVPYSYGPNDANGQSKPYDYAARTVSPPPQEPSPVHTAGNGDWRHSSYQHSNITDQEPQQYQVYDGQQQIERTGRYG